MQYNKHLFNIAQDAIKRAREKQSFVSAEQLAQSQAAMDPAMAGMVDPATGQPMDPAMMQGGGAPPMDPAAMMAIDPAMAAGAAPMDPSMMGMDPAAMQQQQQAAMAPDGLPSEGVPAEGGGGGDNQNIKETIKEVLQETGVIKEEKPKPEEQYAYLTSLMESIAGHLNIPLPEKPIAGEEGGGAGSGSEGDASGGMGQESSLDVGSLAPTQLNPSQAQPTTQSKIARMKELLRK